MTLPVPVTLNRFFDELWVFCFGICHSSLLMDLVFNTLTTAGQVRAVRKQTISGSINLQPGILDRLPEQWISWLELIFTGCEEHHHVAAFYFRITVNLPIFLAGCRELPHYIVTTVRVGHFTAAKLDNDLDSISILQETAGILGLVS